MIRQNIHLTAFHVPVLFIKNQIGIQGIKIEAGSGEKVFFEGEIVVVSMGMREKRAETESLRAAAGESTVFEIGDCVRSAKVYEAVSEGFMAAMKII